MKYLNTKISLYLAVYCVLNSCATVKKAPVPQEKPINSGAFYEGLQDTAIRIVAPSSGFEPESIARLKELKQLNLDIPDDISEVGIPYHAHSDEARFQHLRDAFNAKAPIVWSLRGGYGSARLFDALKTLERPAQEKLFIGFSDSTFLHLFLSKWGWKTIHGTMALEMLDANKNPKNFQRLFDIIAGRVKTLSYGDFEALNASANAAKELKGSLLGGNMTILTNSLGTPWQLNGARKIVFIEDAGTRGYVVDRSLNHLKQAGVFKGAVAVIFGSFSGDEFVDYALKRFADDIGIPVYRAPKFGHQSKNYPLVFNTPSIIIKDEKKEGRYRLITPLPQSLLKKKPISESAHTL